MRNFHEGDLIGEGEEKRERVVTRQTASLGAAWWGAGRACSTGKRVKRNLVCLRNKDRKIKPAKPLRSGTRSYSMTGKRNSFSSCLLCHVWHT